MLVRYEDRLNTKRSEVFVFTLLVFYSSVPSHLLIVIDTVPLHLQTLHLLKKEQHCLSVFKAYFNKVYELKPERINSTFFSVTSTRDLLSENKKN